MPVTDWPENAAIHRLLEATLIFKEIHGTSALQGFLKAELARESVLADIAKRKTAVASTDTCAEQEEAAEHLDIALKVLQFYADAGNYKGRFPAVALDKGKRARAAFEAISGEAESDDEEAE